MNSRVTAFVLLSAAVAGLPASRIGAQEQLPTFRSMANGVAVDVTVRDSKRKSVVGLKPADFEVYDNGVRQEVAEISYGKLPIDVTVALDVSFSVTGVMLERLRSGVVTLMRDLAREDRLRLILFNSRVARVVDFTTDENKVEAAIKAAAAGGGTALFDSISVALVTPAPRERRQLVVVFTDGNDSTSTTQPTTLTNVALRTRAAVTMVLPGTGPVVVTGSGGSQQVITNMKVSLVPQPYDGFFQSLAKATGGSVVRTDASSNLNAVFRQILEEFRSAYVLLYDAKGVESGYHELEVKVKRDGVIVSARRGYWN
ncbi:MAG TPA: VWA domain-containing protein [Vicinamibacterales bacterium]|nr:VWA domain-containing protein [Vicinamibacterales bacterium]